MSPEEHTSEAERLAERAGTVIDAEWGIYASMGTQERILRRSADLQAAQVHATLAQTAVARDHIRTLHAFMAAMMPEPAPAEPAEEPKQ